MHLFVSVTLQLPDLFLRHQATKMHVLAILATLWLPSFGVAEGQTGTEFYLAFMGLDSYAFPVRDGYYRTAAIFVTNPGDTPARVRVSYLAVPLAFPHSLNLAGGASQEVSLSIAVILSGAEKHEACAVVSSDAPVLVQASLTYADGGQMSMAGYPVLPVTSMTGDYVVATHCYTNKCVFVVTSAEDGNAVDVRFRIEGSGRAWYEFTQFGDGQQFQETLNKGQSLQVTCDGCDMTGTLVSASGKVIVVGGGDFTRYDGVRGNQDMLAEVMLPLQFLGQEYVLGSGWGLLYEIVKVVVLKAGDSFTYNGVQQAAAAKDRQVYVMPTRAMSDAVRVQASSPVMVVEVVAGQLSYTSPDVSMTLPLPVSQWNSVYSVYLPMDQEFLVLSLVTTAGTLPVYYTSVAASIEPSVASGSLMTTILSFAAGGSVVTIRCANNCLFTGFFMHGEELMAAVVPLLHLQLELETTTEVATTTEAEITTETETTTEVTGSTEAETTTEVATTTEATASTEAETTTEVATTTEVTASTEAETTTEVATTTEVTASTEADTTTEVATTTEVTASTEAETTTEVATTTEVTASTEAETTTEVATTTEVTASTEADTTTEVTPEVETTTGTTTTTTEATASMETETTTEAATTTMEAGKLSTAMSSQATSRTSNQATTQSTTQTSTDVSSSLSPTVRSSPQPGAPAWGCGTGQRCYCLVYNIPENNTTNSTQDATETPTDELLLDRKSLSAYIRTITSAENKKPSSVYVGSMVGIAMFATTFAAIVLPDLLSLSRYVLKKACRPHHSGQDA